MTTTNIFDMTDTWNNIATTFTAVRMNVTDTASAAGSMLIDLQVGGVSQFRVSKGGRITAQTLTLGLGGQTAVANNSAFGLLALNSAGLTGDNNSAFGGYSLFQLTTGASNSAFGRGTLFAATTAEHNTAVGVNSLSGVTTGSYNSGVGLGSGQSVTTGENNSCFGHNAGAVITTGSRNTIIGRNSNPSANNVNDETVVGEGLTGKGADTAFIGGTNGAYNEKNVTTWETTSDARIKKHIADFAGGLDVLEQLRVRTFQYRLPDEITDLPASAAINQPGVQLGVIAQELATVLPECVTENSTGVLSVNTDPLVWYLINAVKELSAEVKKLKGF